MSFQYTLILQFFKQYFPEMQSDVMDEELYDLILPSDHTWQTKIYYKLVEKQRLG